MNPTGSEIVPMIQGLGVLLAIVFIYLAMSESPNRYCPKCKGLYREGATICPHCRSELNEEK